MPPVTHSIESDAITIAEAFAGFHHRTGLLPELGNREICDVRYSRLG